MPENIQQSDQLNISKRKKRIAWNKGKKGEWKISKEHLQAIINANKGRSPANKGKHPTEETIRKLCESHKGKIPWNKGKTISEETKKKIGESVKKKLADKEVKEKMIHARKGRTPNKGKHHTEETKRVMSNNCPWKGQHISEQHRLNMCHPKKNSRKWRQKQPTKPEQKIINVILNYNLPFMFTGIKCPTKELKCKPDFMSIERKLIIEVFGNFFHKNSVYFPNIEQSDEKRLSYLRRKGWKNLVLWEEEINSSSDEQLYLKILRFINEN